MENLIDKLVSAIATMEGWFTDQSVPCRRNNNPGNLRGSPWLMRPKDTKGFVIFNSPAEGIAGAYHQVALDIARGATLRMLISKWAPPTENNTKKYISNVASWTGVDPDKQLWEYLSLVQMKG